MTNSSVMESAFEISKFDANFFFFAKINPNVSAITRPIANQINPYNIYTKYSFWIPNVEVVLFFQCK